MIEAAILVVFPFAMAFAAISDFLSMTIQNKVPLILVGSFLILAPLTGMAWPVFGMHIVAAVVVLAACFVLFAIASMGGGDAKLIAATALWMGWNTNLVFYLAAMSVLGGLLTLLILVYRASPVTVLAGRVECLRRLADKNEGVPYGMALGAAGLVVFPQTELGLWVINRLVGA